MDEEEANSRFQMALKYIKTTASPTSLGFSVQSANVVPMLRILAQEYAELSRGIPALQPAEPSAKK
jgi:hypothetical protein